MGQILWTQGWGFRSRRGGKEKPKSKLESGGRKRDGASDLQTGGDGGDELSAPWNQPRAQLQVNSPAEGWGQPSNGTQG